MAGKRRNPWLKKALGLIMAVTLIVQALQPAFPGSRIVRAAEGESAELTELVQNGDFSDVSADGQTAANWEVRKEGATTARFEDGKVVFDIQTMGADWANYLKYTPGIDLKNGQVYVISFTAKSSVARTIQYGFDGGRIGIMTTDLNAEEEAQIRYEFTAPQDWSANPYMFYLGNIDNKTNPTEAHTVEISNFSVKTSGEVTNPGGGGTGGEVTPPADADTEDGEPVEAVEGNLLVNGNFENKQEGWESYSDNTDIYWNKYRTVFQIKGNAADWTQALVQNVMLEAGMEYIVSFDVESTVDRTVAAGFDNSGRDEFHSDVIPANTKTTLTYTTTKAVSGSNKFMIYLGTDVGAHKVVISNVSIVEKPVILPNDENDTAPEPLTSIQGLNPEDYFILKDGRFTNGLNRWEHWEAEWMTTWDVVKYTPVDNGMNVYIGNVGDGEGNLAHDVQLNQRIDLKAGLQYTLSFDVHTEKARAINVVIMELETGNFVKTIGLKKGETRHVVYNIPVQSEDALDKLFSIQMGKVTGDVQKNTLTFSNMKIEVNGYEDLAALIDDGDFTDGLGSFTAGEAIAVEDKSIAATITEDTDTAVLTRSGLSLEAGMTYQLSFVAGAVSNHRVIFVKLPDGETREVTLSDDAALYTLDITPTEDITEGEIQFLLNGTADVICLDTVRLDKKGFASAAGIKLDCHNITRLTKKEAPVISEDPNGVAGKDIVLTFVDSDDGAYAESINGIRINGEEIDSSKYTVGNGKITLDKSLFSLSEEEKQVFSIEVKAHWYTSAKATQIVYRIQKWEQTWSDEFNDTSLDTSKWSYQDGTGAEYGLDGWGNNEQQYYTRDNLTVGNGAMTITATKGTHSGKAYDSARIWTMNDDQKTAKFSQTYGRFEAKMKLPAGEGCQGLWPAFWLLPVDSVYGGWPLSGEIDIMEARGREGNKADGTIHYGKPWPNDGSAGGTYVWDEETDPLAITEYHIYSVDWTPEYMSFQVDGVEYYRTENWFSEDADQPVRYAFPAPFDQEFYIVLNMAVGGNYDGNRNPSQDALPAEMKVDYVRVYQSVTPVEDSYIVPDPVVIPEEIPADAKTDIIDPNFEDIKTVVNDNDPKNVDGWNLLALSQFGGAANVETVDIDGTAFAKVNIVNTGSQNYSIQLTQKLSLYKGNWYTLSFDAKADSAREIISKIGGDGTISWSAYNSDTTKLTKDIKHYEYTFQMLNDSDPYSRLELNMGGGSSASVYIGNVEFKQTEGLTIDYDIKKTPLENGNHIYNGMFQLGTTDRMAYWHTTDEENNVVVKEGKEYFFHAGSEAASTLYQTGLELLQSDTYKLTFDAKGSGNVTVTFTGEDGVYYTESAALGDTMENHQVIFTMPAGVTDKNGVLTFAFEGGQSVDLDNIVLTRETYNNVDFSGLNCYPLPNGDFELDELGWSASSTTLTILEGTDGNSTKVGRVEGKVTANRWDALLSYGGLDLLGGYTYVLSFDVRADKDAVIDLTLEDSYYNRVFAQTNIEVGADWITYTYTFKLSSDMSNLSLKFLTGGAKEAYHLDLDNVDLHMKGAPARPGSFLPDDYNRLGKDVVMTHSGTEAWSQAAVLYLDGEAVPSEKVTFSGNQVTLAQSLFTESRIYTISATAEGFADSAAISFRMYPENGDRICNGDLFFGDAAWETYIHNGSAVFDYSNPYLSVRYLHAEADQWGLIPWSIQFNQSVTIDQPGTYELSFVAYSEAERYIMVGFDGQTHQKVLLTKTPQVHTVTLTANAAGSYKVMFQMGSVNVNTENGYFVNDSEDYNQFVDFGPHNLYLDSISLLPEGTEVEKNSELEDTRIMHAVTITNGSAVSGVEDIQMQENGTITGKAETVTIVRVQANTPENGMKFHHWEVNGQTVCYDETYSFYITCDSAITAVYTEEEPEQEVLINIVSVEVNQTTRKISFSAERFIPEGYTLVEHGVIVATKSLPEADFEIGGTGVKKAKASTTGMTGTYKLSVSNVPAGKTAYARGYVIYRDASGMEHTVYSAIASGTMR